MEKNILDKMEENIDKTDINETEKNELKKNFLHLKEQKLNLMITGATGAGKSSTINALFNMEVAKVGVTSDPETMEITNYTLGNLVLWDTPGLGDGKEADAKHTKNIINKLLEKDEKGNLLIDLVLVILDGSSRDLGTSYELINNVIIPNLGEDKNRVLIAINQADIAMKGRYWNHEENKPEPELVEFLEQKVKSVHERIKEGTGLDITPIYYSAGFKEEGGSQEKPYNLSKLLYYIIRLTPKNKRLPYIENINKNPAMWEDDDNLKNYKKDIISELSDAIEEGVTKGSSIGGTIGELILGEKGKTIGKIAGAAAGAVTGLVVGGLKIIFNLK
ncbi:MULTISPECIES: GTPase family protein [Fusobacterium]|nr:GTPase [Fusobacterium sp.]